MTSARMILLAASVGGAIAAAPAAHAAPDGFSFSLGFSDGYNGLGLSSLSVGYWSGWRHSWYDSCGSVYWRACDPDPYDCWDGYGPSWCAPSVVYSPVVVHRPYGWYRPRYYAPVVVTPACAPVYVYEPYCWSPSYYSTAYWGSGFSFSISISSGYHWRRSYACAPAYVPSHHYSWHRPWRGWDRWDCDDRPYRGPGWHGSRDLGYADRGPTATAGRPGAMGPTPIASVGTPPAAEGISRPLRGMPGKPSTAPMNRPPALADVKPAPMGPMPVKPGAKDEPGTPTTSRPLNRPTVGPMPGKPSPTPTTAPLPMPGAPKPTMGPKPAPVPAPAPSPRPTSPPAPKPTMGPKSAPVPAPAPKPTMGPKPAPAPSPAPSPSARPQPGPSKVAPPAPSPQKPVSPPKQAEPRPGPPAPAARPAQPMGPGPKPGLAPKGPQAPGPQPGKDGKR